MCCFKSFVCSAKKSDGDDDDDDDDDVMVAGCKKKLINCVGMLGIYLPAFAASLL